MTSTKHWLVAGITLGLALAAGCDGQLGGVVTGNAEVGDDATTVDANTDVQVLVDTGSELAQPDVHPGDLWNEEADSTDSGADADLPPPDCIPTREFWEANIWEPFMSNKCVNCHGGDGLASATEFILTKGDAPEDLNFNYAGSRKAATLTNGGKRLLLEKPTALLPHGGGKQIAFNSPEHLALIEFVNRVLTPVSCDP